MLYTAVTDGVCILELTVDDSYVVAWCEILFFFFFGKGGVASLFSVSSALFEVNLLVVNVYLFPEPRCILKASTAGPVAKGLRGNFCPLPPPPPPTHPPHTLKLPECTCLSLL